MNNFRYHSVSICLTVMIIVALTACSEPGKVSPVPSESLSLEPSKTASTSMPMGPLATAATEDVSIRLTRITEQGIIGVRWSEDGQAVMYTTERRDSTGENWEEEWWRYDTSSGEVQSICPPFTVASQLWVGLGARPIGTGIWFWGALSPSGTQVVYNRLPPGHNYTPAPNEFYLPPYEIWTARSDGSNARSLGRCWYVGQVIWFDQERKIIYSCGYEGPPEIYVANVDGTSSTWLNNMTAFEGLLGGWMALSPDETTLALTDEVGKLQIVPLDGGPIQYIAQWGSVSTWSPDSHRLYYLQGQGEFARFGNLYVYELGAKTSTEVLSSPVHVSDGKEINLAINKFVVSPLENTAVFENQGLWLVTWSP